MTTVKFCGLTRREDVAHAASLGAAFVGAILTESPRRVTPAAARALFEDIPASIRRVGVVGNEAPSTISRQIAEAAVNVVQLHGDQDADAVARVRNGWDGDVWWVARVTDRVPPVAYEMAASVDAVVLDARVAGRLGGTGHRLDWARLGDDVERLRAAGARIVLAGGLTADNVREAMALLRPHVVDVSSGVESGVGIKDHERMRAFRDAVRDGARG